MTLAILLLLGSFALLLALLAAQLRRPSGWFGRRVMAGLLNEGNKRLLDAAVEAAAPGSEARVLDVGFGGGYSLERLARAVGPERVAGVEFSEAMIGAVRGRLGEAIDLRLADAGSLPFPDRCFDVVLSVNTLYFWPDPARVLAEMSRVLRPGGRLVLGYRSRLHLATSPVSWFGFRLYGDRRIAQLLGNAGLHAETRTGWWGERIAVGLKPGMRTQQAWNAAGVESARRRGAMEEGGSGQGRADVRCAECGTVLQEGQDREVTEGGVFCRPCFEGLTAQLRQALDDQGQGVDYGKAIAGGVAGAVLGVLAWWGFTVLTHIAFGLVAVVIGVAVGKGVVMGSGNKRHRNLQILSAAISAGGFVYATYLVNRTFIHRAYAEKGEPIALPLLPGLDLLFRVVAVGFGVMDLVFLAIVLYEAWKIPAPVEIPLARAR